MNTPLLPPDVLMGFLTAAKGLRRDADLLGRHPQDREAFKTFAALADPDDAGAPFKLAAYYYMAQDEVRAALWRLMIGIDLQTMAAAA